MVTLITITSYQSLLNFGNMSLYDLFKESITGLGNLGLIDFDLMYNKAMHFMVLLINIIHISTCELLGWLYDDTK